MNFLKLNRRSFLRRLALTVGAVFGIPRSASAVTVDDGFEFQIFGSDGSLLWIADYLRALPSGVGWTDGDRSGYFCAYAFLVDSRSRLLGRVWVHNIQDPDVRPRDASWAKIIDKFMVEGARYFDGSLAPPGSNELGDCPVTEIPYTPYTGPTQEPVITYNPVRGGTPYETRNYPALDIAPGVTFQVIENTPSRVTVVAYHNTIPQVAFYYDTLSPRVVMNSVLG